MRKWGLVLMMIILLSGCAVKSETAMEYVEDGLESTVSKPYTIVFSVPQDVTQETFGDAGSAQVYEAANGDYMITTEVLEATSVEEAIETVSGIPAERLDVVTLKRLPMEEYHFAWASSSEEADTVSRCALIAGEDYYYVMTMTERAGLGTTYDETADSIFSTFSLSMEEDV